MNVATVTTVALSLFILGSFLLFLRNLNVCLKSLQTQYQVTFEIERDLPRTRQDLLRETIRSDHAVRSVRLITREEAMERMVKENPQHREVLAAL